jgi:hypothetical protein
MNWNLIGQGLRLSYLLRVPLLTFLLLATLGPISFSNNLLANLLDQDGNGWHLFTVSFAAFLLGFTAVTTANLILHYGNLRFEGRFEQQLAQRRPILVFLSGCIAATILDVYVYVRTVEPGLWKIAPLALGAAAALALVFAAKIVQLLLTEPAVTPHPPPFLVFPAYFVKPLERFFDDLYCSSSARSKALKARVGTLSQFPLEIIRPAAQGYLIHLEPPPGEPLGLLSGHVFALSLAIIAFLSYLIIGISKSNITAERAAVPGLAFVLLFFIVACWLLAALTFFFDRYRFPLLWTIAALAAITALTPQSDHFFRVQQMQGAMPKASTAAEYLKGRLASLKLLSNGPKRIVLVATPGGGIQAAAWTGQVLQGLERNSNFHNSVALISSVSGGSLGSMIYAAGFVDPKIQVAHNALQPAIDEVAWGWTVPDFWRTVLPWFLNDRTIDRGWALEKKWSAINNLNDTGDAHGTMLSQWAGAASAGKMPALLINSMIVETGAPVVFTNTDFPVMPENKQRILNFYSLCPNPPQGSYYDIRVNTAARLSASFSYVAPASRPSVDSPFGVAYHFVDGGYYDNFGINSLLAWLAEGLEDSVVADGLKDVLILQIRHFNVPEPTKLKQVGWGFQIAAPPLALYHQRDYAQASTANNQLEFFAKYYATRNINVWTTYIKYDGTGTCAEAPLSWKLDKNQQDCIARTWATQTHSDAIACIDDYLAGDDPGKHCKLASRGGEEQ